MTHVQDERIKPKKGKKRKANDEDSKAVVPESDLVTPQNDETNTLAATGKAKKKAMMKKKSKAKSTGDTDTSQQQKPSEAEDENCSDDEKDLSPEEKRVLERKMKKILKKEEKKKLKEEGKSVEKNKVQSNLAEKVALEYLTCWFERRDEWKFHKGRQIWLLQHMYDTTKVTDDHFKVLLAYLEGMRGASRDITLQKAEAILRLEGQGEEEDTADAEKKKQRAKQVVQLL
ncbi:uncharacterized protein C7orf50 homolog [Carassius carassius]|uniref:uncharacterized protein C7orf50 homolog n=1 Tax=Carassius carassius TaxID=217509 RepID=UPI0028686319|nr:uncharacterized protein C7orf50 homolog [Carassius carassius]